MEAKGSKSRCLFRRKVQAAADKCLEYGWKEGFVFMCAD